MWFFHFHQSFFSSVETLKRSKVCSTVNGDSLFDGYRCNNLVTCSFPAVASWPCFTLFNLGRGWGGDHACFRIYSPSFTFNLLLWWLVRLDVICTNKDNDLPKNNPDSYPPHPRFLLLYFLGPDPTLIRFSSTNGFSLSVHPARK